jgi:ubiquinone/menaquinone biosynthesis C-methylase UbiE
LGDYKNVDIIADLKNVPFRDSCAQMIVSNSVLEHIYDYQLVISEIHRILEKNGILYLCVPSVCRQHHSIDYHRWTAEGLERLVSDQFTLVESGVSRGISHFLVMYVHYVFDLKVRSKAIRKPLKKIWNILSLPLFLFREDHSKSSQSLAQTIYIIARKK